MSAYAKNIEDADLELTALCRKGDTNAFEKLVIKYEKKMFNIAYRIIGNYEEACEAAQDAFVSAYKNLGEFEGRSKFSTWLTAITVNFAKNRLRQLKAGRTVISIGTPFSEEDGRITIDPPDKNPGAPDILEQKDISEKLLGCIDSLESEYKETLVLRDMQDYSYEEIGEILGIAEGTVKSRLSRARESVKNCLKKALGKLWQTVIG